MDEEEYEIVFDVDSKFNDKIEELEELIMNLSDKIDSIQNFLEKKLN
tara:strand:- start:714 stop:854 length:141 start_codon:yes stop_codon:yes gene_type:complete